MAAHEPAGAAVVGLDGTRGGGGRRLACDGAVSRTPLERAAGEGESPVGDGWCGRGARDA